MLIETQGTKEWMAELQKLYNLTQTTMNESEEAFTVILTRGKQHNVLVGRYCRVTGKGVVLDKRKKVRT